MSPLATLAYKQGAVGDTGLKTGWVWDTFRTSLNASVLWYKCYSLASVIPRVSVPWVTIFTAVLSNCTHFTAKCTRKRVLRQYMYKKCKTYCKGACLSAVSRSSQPFHAVPFQGTIAHQSIRVRKASKRGWRSQDFEQQLPRSKQFRSLRILRPEVSL